METVSDSVSIIEDGRIVYMNENGLQVLGAKSPDEIVGRMFEDLLTPEYRMLAAENYEMWLSETGSTPVKMICLDGRLLDIEMTLQPYSGGAEGALVAIGRDITERSLAAVTLLERERRITAIMENVADGIVVIDEVGQIESFNKAAQTMFGYAQAEVIGQNVKMLMNISDRERHDGYLSAHMKKKARTEEVLLGRNRNFVGRRKDGSTFVIELAIREMVNGTKHTFIGSISDITERKLREEAVRRSEMLLKEIVDNAPLQITLSDETGRYALVNRSFAAAHSCDPETLLGKSIYDLYPEDIARTYAMESQDVLDNGIIREQERQIPGDEERFERVIQFPIPGNYGGSAGVGTIITDVTKQKTLEAQLRQSGRLNAVGELAGGIAHDFNNILMVISGYASRAANDPGDIERVEAALAEIISAASRATNLTKQLLTFSRHKVLASKVVQVAPLVTDLTSMLSPLLGALVTLGVKPVDKGIFVETDAAQLSQVLANFAINARDAMPEGGELEIGVDVSEVSDDLRERFPQVGPGSYARFFVKDNGEGMDADTVERIFEPFFTTKDQGKGTGLGLSMAYGFVQQSKGMLDVKSKPGQGTTMEIYLPVAEGPPEATERTRLESYSSQGETILVAEDDDAIRRLAVLTLEDAGYTVLAASDGFEALEVEDEYDGTIDLLLSDIVMPGLGGIELSQAILDTRPEIKILFMSGYPSRGEMKTFDLPKGVPLLQKPFDPNSLAINIREILDGNDLISEEANAT
jgi:PAS domain S-box-containing protein